MLSMFNQQFKKSSATLLSILQGYIETYGGVMWPFQETSGLVAESYNTALAIGRELLIDGDMEAADTSAYTAVNSGTLSKETSDPPSGSTRYLRVTYNSQANPGAQQFTPAAGRTYRVAGKARVSGGSVEARIQLDGKVAGSITSTNWTDFSTDITTTGTTTLRMFAIGAGVGEYAEFDNITVKQINIAASSAFSTPGDNPLDGAITGATSGQTGPTGSDYSYLFDGINDYVDIYSPEINSFFDPTKGTLLALAKVSGAGVWTDSSIRVVAKINSDSSNQIGISRTATNNQLQINYSAGGTNKVILTNSLNSTDWMLFAVTWDTIADEVKAYINTSQTGSTQTGLGTWVGNLSTTQTIIGANITTPSLVWDGFEAYPILFRDVLTLTDIQAIAAAAGIT